MGVRAGAGTELLSEKPEGSMTSTTHKLWRAGRRALAGAGLISASGIATAAYQVNFQAPVTRIASEIYDLHMLMMYIIVAIFCAVFGVMFYSIYAHRKSVGHKAKQFHENTTVEIVWTVVPILILVGMAIPATKTLLSYKDTSAPELTIKSVGYQWKWGYDYMKGEGEGISFLSALATPQDQITGSVKKGENYLLEVDNPLVVPVGRKVRLLLTANDVIHAWWVPAFGVKQDAIPGFVRDAWFKADKEGVYRGQCAELCGKEHGFMPIVVNVVSQAKYTEWVAEQKKKQAATADDPNKTWTLDELKARGEKVYAANCVACHQASGLGVPGAFPALDGSKMVKGPKEAHIDQVLNGKSGTAMASYKQLSDVELAAVITYERNAWNNKSGDMVAPAELKARRK
jgi:cytochrome c oxidase subunit 2